MRVGGKRRRRGGGASSERERRRHGGAAPPGTEIQSGGAVGFGKPGACAAACWERAGWAWGWDGGASRTGVSRGLARRARVFYIYRPAARTQAHGLLKFFFGLCPFHGDVGVGCV